MSTVDSNNRLSDQSDFSVGRILRPQEVEALQNAMGFAGIQKKNETRDSVTMPIGYVRADIKALVNRGSVN